MKVLAILAFLFVCILGMHYSGVVHFDFLEEERMEQLKKSQEVPNLKLKLLSGKEIQLHDLKGSIVLLNFWASWCGPCVEEFPSMISLIQKMHGKVKLLAISNDSDLKDIDDFFDRFKNLGDLKNHPDIFVVWDHDLKISQDQFNVIKFPETIILNQRMEMERKVVGVTDWVGDSMLKYLESL